MACERNPVRVGFAGTLTGPYSDLGIHGRNGCRLAVEDINAAGGLRGRPVELIVRNDAGTPDGARQAYRELTAKGVLAVIGHMTSALSLSTLPLTEETGVPLISPTTSTPLLRGRKDLFFRVQSASDVTARALARWLTGRPSIRTVCTVRDVNNDAYSNPWEAAFVEEFERLSGHILSRLEYRELNAADLESLTERMTALQPDAILFISSARDAALLVRSLENAGIKSLLLSTAWAQTEAFLNDVGPLSERLIFAADNAPTDITTTLREFTWRYRKRFGIAPSFAAVRAYEAVHFLATAFNEAEGKRERFVERLMQPRIVDGLYGKIRIDAFGDASGETYVVGVRNGRFVVLEWMSGDPL